MMLLAREFFPTLILHILSLSLCVCVQTFSPVSPSQIPSLCAVWTGLQSLTRHKTTNTNVKTEDRDEGSENSPKGDE